MTELAGVSINDPMDRILKVNAVPNTKEAGAVSINDPMDRILKDPLTLQRIRGAARVSINDPMDRILKVLVSREKNGRRADGFNQRSDG